MSIPETLLLTRSDVASLLTLDDCMKAVATAFASAARGLAPRPGVLGFRMAEGGFHIKTAALPGAPGYFAAKLNGNFFRNRERFGLPAIQGLIILCDAENGSPLAVMDSIEITILRTGAATGIAAQALLRPAARVVTICGAGNQGRVSLRALRRVMNIAEAYVWDIDPAAARLMAEDLRPEFDHPITPVTDLREATLSSDAVVTCTPSRRAFLGEGDVRPGTFVAAVGTDSEEKSEIAPSLMARATVVTDSTDQCARIGDLHHAIEAGVRNPGDVHAELGEILAGLRPGRTRDDEVIVFDSTGTALQDVAAAGLVFERAVKGGRGMKFRFSAAW